VLMQGVTAHYLATDTYPIRPGDPVLVHAAAGGVGYDNFADQVRDLTDGHGVAVVYDGIGATAFEGSLAALRIRGTLAVLGPPVVPLRRWRSLDSTRADRCTSPDPRSCTTPRLPKSSAAAQTTSSAGWPRGISRSTSAAATRSHKSVKRSPRSKRAGRPASYCWFAERSSSGYRNLTKIATSSARGASAARKRTTSQSRDVAVSGVTRSTSFSESASRRSGGGLESVMR
jgi:hypothetical protein